MGEDEGADPPRAGPRRYLLTVAALAAALGVVWLAGYLAPLRHALDRLAGPETTGLIFVESPEVYTRQRLVNDRYRQDAWLRTQLDLINDPDATFVDLRRWRETVVRARIAAGEAGTLERAAAPPADTTPIDVPFGTEFQLRSAARDKIRQLILENALDDRHDLSGNTVFGLKFDTSVLPGSNTWLSPAVIVRMEPNPLDRLHTADSQTLAAYYLNVYDPDWIKGLGPGDLEDFETTLRFADYFNKWRLNLQQRITEHKGATQQSCAPADGVRAGEANAVLLGLDQPLCSDTDTVTRRAVAALDELFAERSALDEALQYVLRLPEDHAAAGEQMQAQILGEAVRQCAPDAAKPASIRDFLASLPTTRRLRLPLPWGEMFELRVSHELPEPDRVCPATLDLSLDGLEVELVFIDQGAPVPLSDGLGPTQVEAGAVLPSAGWTAVTCGPGACPDANRSPWMKLPDVSPESREAVTRVMTNTVVGAILDRVSPTRHGASDAGQNPDERCFARWRPQDDWYHYGERLAEAHAQVCYPGLASEVFFRLGAYNFLQRMTEVESYTYAAFPKGDVSGVVSETGTSARLEASGSLGAATGAATGIARRERARSAEAVPSLLNFASGKSDDPDEAAKLFDFGWAIVKEGRKRPMVASQLVLVSVPAYLEELTLEIWQGFLDVDRMPQDRERYNALDLESRIERLHHSFEKRTVTFNVPPDYPALDGVVIESSLSSGPVIDVNGLSGTARIHCDGSLYLVIPGERLWRSTVATLGGVKATSIEVMPDMRGLLARFEFAGVHGMAGPAPLEVWTSEGHTPPHLVDLRPSEGCGGRAVAAGSSAADLAGQRAANAR